MGFLGRISQVPPHLPLTHAEVFILSSNAPFGPFGPIFVSLGFFLPLYGRPWQLTGRRASGARAAPGPAGRSGEPQRAGGACAAGQAGGGPLLCAGLAAGCRRGVGSGAGAAGRHPRGWPRPAERARRPLRAACAARGGGGRRAASSRAPARRPPSPAAGAGGPGGSSPGAGRGAVPDSRRSGAEAAERCRRCRRGVRPALGDARRCQSGSPRSPGSGRAPSALDQSKAIMQDGGPISSASS